MQSKDALASMFFCYIKVFSLSFCFYFFPFLILFRFLYFPKGPNVVQPVETDSGPVIQGPALDQCGHYRAGMVIAVAHAQLHLLQLLLAGLVQDLAARDVFGHLPHLQYLPGSANHNLKRFVRDLGACGANSRKARGLSMKRSRSASA